MIVLLIIVLVLAVAVVALAGVSVQSQARRSLTPAVPARGRILFPFVDEGLCVDALDSALRLAAAEHCTLVPTFLVRVSLTLPLAVSLPQQGGLGLELLDVIEQRACRFGVSVDTRVERGRSYRHALRQAIAGERYDRIVVAAAQTNGRGITPEDVRWLLDNAPGEIVVLRPSAAPGLARSVALDAPEPGSRHRGSGPRQRRSLRTAGARARETSSSQRARATVN